jgi:hypothetical protein
VAGWELARDFLAARDAFSSTALHRALRADATLRFVNVARVKSVAAWQEAVTDPDFPGAALPFTAHPALYEIVREEGEPEGAGGVVFIDLADVPAGEDARFLTDWERVRELLAVRQGFLGARVLRSLGPADFRLVTIVRWSSPLMYARTLQQPEIAEALAASPFPSHRALYLPIQG